MPPLGLPPRRRLRDARGAGRVRGVRSSSSAPWPSDPGLRADRRQRASRGRDLPPARRPAAGHRAGRRAGHGCCRRGASAPGSTSASALLTGGARDLPARQQTLRGAIDWSHDLLDAPTGACSRRFAVFAGGACLDAGRGRLRPAGELGHDVLDGLDVARRQEPGPAGPAAHGEPRFAMLETIREYAHERLAETASPTSPARHAAGYSGSPRAARPSSRAGRPRLARPARARPRQPACRARLGGGERRTDIALRSWRWHVALLADPRPPP